MTNINVWVVLLALLVGCGGTPVDGDAGLPSVDTGIWAVDDAGLVLDSETADSGQDSAVEEDGGVVDAGEPADSDVLADGGVDSGTDGGIGSEDATVPDTDTGTDPSVPVAVDVNGDGSCLLTSSNQMWCWGHGLTTPTYIADAVELSGTCGIAADGAVFCWGVSGVTHYPGTDAAVLGPFAYAATTGEVRALGLASPSWTPLTNIDSMPAQYCAIHVDGALTCWDLVNAAAPGQPVDLEFSNFWSAVSGSATYDVVDVARRGAFSTDDIVVCYAWTGSMPGPGGGDGPGVYCATERGTTGSPLIRRGVEVETAGGRTCAVVPEAWFGTEHHPAGTYCLSDRPASLSDTGYWPLNPLPGDDAVGTYTDIIGTDLAVGADHACVMRDGNILCWGSNARGQLGNGTTTPSTTPVVVAW